MLDPQQLLKIKSVLFQSTEDRLPMNTFAILDAAQDKILYPNIINPDAKSLCLFHGSRGVELATVAPYLVQLNRDGAFTDWVLSHGWGKSWGIFLRSTESLETVQRHLRSFLMVYNEDGKPLYFRYYDPRVFRVYLPTCNPAELKMLFGPVLSFYAEGPAETLMEFTCTKSFALMANEIGIK